MKNRLRTTAGAFALAMCLASHGQATIRFGAVGDSLTDEYLKSNDQAAVDVAAWNWVQTLAAARSADIDFGIYKPSPLNNWGGSRDTGYEYNWAKSGAVAADQTRMNVIGFGSLPVTVFGSDYLSTQITGLASQITAGQIDTVFVGAGANDFYFRTNWLDGAGNATPIELGSLNLPQMTTEITNGILYAVDAALAAGNVQVLVARVHVRDEAFTDARSLAITAAAENVNINLVAAVATRQALGKSIAMVDLWEWGTDPLDPHKRNPDGSLTIGDLIITNTAASADIADGDMATAGTPGTSTTLCNSLGYCATPMHPTHFTSEDGLHPNTAIQALLANEVIQALNTHFSAGIAPLTDAEIYTLIPPLDSDFDGIPNNIDPDDDNDGIADNSDNCPTSFNGSTDQTNTDGDAQGNICDLDDDNDGVPDTLDAFPLDPTETLDTDGDGIGDNSDNDADNDGIVNGIDNCPFSPGLGNNQTDTDGDGAGNLCDSDDDNDGTPDITDAFPLDASETQDADGDGIGNVADTDDDGDGVADNLDNCPLSPGLGADQTDTDGDGLGSPCDNDDDNDAVIDLFDAFPQLFSVSEDQDNDNWADKWNSGCNSSCQTASGVILDNCPGTTNNNQLNTDGDTQGDACDLDDDNDRLSDDDEIALGTDPLNNTSGPALLTVISFESGLPAGWSKPAVAQADWVSTTSTASHLTTSLRAGPITHNQRAQIQVTLPVYGSSVYVDVKTSTEANLDNFRIFVDGSGKHVSSGTQAWRTVSLATTTGSRTIKFDYWKNASISSGDDTVWIDRLSYIDNTDTDSDGLLNVVDSDDDSDGLPDVMDPLPLQAQFNLNSHYRGSHIHDKQSTD